MVLHVHLADDDPIAQVEQGHRRLALLDQVRQWCTQSMTQVVVKPVVDLNHDLSCDGYQPSDRLRDQVILRDKICVFPWCTRNARACDLDHTTPREHGGPTSTENMAALCRRHHRLKTHTTWSYERTGPAAYAWTSPHGHRFTRDARGTTAVEPPDH